MSSLMNPHIDPVYWWLTALTLPLWFHALYWNARAAHDGILETVRMRAATAALALIYIVATVYLLFSHVDVGQWSDVLRGLQYLTLPVVWTLPAIMSVRMAHRIRATDRRLAERHEPED